VVALVRKPPVDGFIALKGWTAFWATNRGRHDQHHSPGNRLVQSRKDGDRATLNLDRFCGGHDLGAAGWHRGGILFDQPGSRGGVQPYNWSIPSTSVSVPAGLSLSAAGLISGTPTAPGIVTFTVLATDFSSAPNSSKGKVLQLSVAPIAVTSAASPNGIVNQSYTSALAAVGGTPPYRWAVGSGKLPAGLSLSTAGVISGRPTAAATGTITFRVTDSVPAPANTATASVSLTTTYVPGTITTAAGNGGCTCFGANLADGGPATAAAFHNPFGIAVDSVGNLYIADTDDNRIRKVNTAGVITTVGRKRDTRLFRRRGTSNFGRNSRSLWRCRC
jgi:hypothetical protein